MRKDVTEGYSILMFNLSSVVQRINLEPLMYPRNAGKGVGAQWGNICIDVYYSEENKKVIYAFNHPSEDHTLNDTEKSERTGWHTFDKWEQCLQSMVQHRTFNLVKNVCKIGNDV